MAIALGTAAAGLYYGAMGLRELLAWRNMYKNRGRDPNALVTEDTVRQQMMTPEQQQLRQRELREGMAQLENPQRIYRNAARMPYMRQPQGNIDARINQNPRQRPIGGLARRLQAFEQGQMGGGLRSDYSTVENQITGLNPMGLESSGRQAMRGEAFKGRFNQTLMGQMQMLSDFSTENYMNRLEGARLQRLRDQVQNQTQREGMALGREREGLGQARYMGQRVLNTGETGVLNEFENQRRAAANRRYGYGMTTSNRYQQAPPLLK